MPIVMLMAPVNHKASRALMLVAIALVPLSCDAGPPRPSTDICHLLESMSTFDGKTIELRSEVRFTMHGRHLFGSQCSELGSLGLVISDEKYENKNIISFVRKISSNQGEAIVVIIGQFIHKPMESYRGEFLLKEVVKMEKLK